MFWFERSLNMNSDMLVVESRLCTSATVRICHICWCYKQQHSERWKVCALRSIILSEVTEGLYHLNKLSLVTYYLFFLVYVRSTWLGFRSEPLSSRRMFVVKCNYSKVSNSRVNKFHLRHSHCWISFTGSQSWKSLHFRWLLQCIDWTRCNFRSQW